jgi:hypothetical protein
LNINRAGPFAEIGDDLVLVVDLDDAVPEPPEPSHELDGDTRLLAGQTRGHDDLPSEPDQLGILRPLGSEGGGVGDRHQVRTFPPNPQCLGETPSSTTQVSSRTASP